MKISSKTLALVLALVSPALLSAQNSKIEVTKNLNYRQEVTPQVLDNYLFTTHYATGKKAYNLKGFQTAGASANISSLKINPAGTSYALLSTNGKKASLEIFDIAVQGKSLFNFKKLAFPTAVCYSADSRTLYVANAGTDLLFFDSKTFVLRDQMPLAITPTEMFASPNGYFVVAIAGNTATIVNVADKNIRKTITAAGKIADIDFTSDSETMAILTTTGVLTTHNTHDFAEVQKFDNLGATSSISFHPDGKYIAVATDSKRFVFVNLMDPSDRPSLDDPQGAVSYVRFVRDGKKQTYLSYNSVNTVKYRQIKGFDPNFTKMMKDQLNARMMEWCKRKPNESEKEYQARTSEEAKNKQKKLFAHEIATNLAGNRLAHSNVTLGKYNPSTNTLALNLGNMSPVFLKVPQSEVGSFTNPNDLVFSDAVYGLTKDDKFELIYAKVTNKATGKTYVFDNLEQQSLDFLQTDDSFVPLNLIQKASHEDVVLQGIKKNVINNAKQQNRISDHTHINVNAHVVSDYDANGKRINNYKVEFDYNVDAEYSVKEDFGPGKYKIEQSHAAVSMLQIAQEAFEKDFAQYIKPGKKVVISITGSADAIPINGTIAYDGCYGNFDGEPYYLNGDLGNMVVTSSTGIKKNEQLAFIRAQAVKSYLDKNLQSLKQMNVDHKYYIELNEGTGGEFRRINVSFTFVDAME